MWLNYRYNIFHKKKQKNDAIELDREAEEDLVYLWKIDVKISNNSELRKWNPPLSDMVYPLPFTRNEIEILKLGYEVGEFGVTFDVQYRIIWNAIERDISSVPCILDSDIKKQEVEGILLSCIKRKFNDISITHPQ